MIICTQIVGCKQKSKPFQGQTARIKASLKTSHSKTYYPYTCRFKEKAYVAKMHLWNNDKDLLQHMPHISVAGGIKIIST